MIKCTNAYFTSTAPQGCFLKNKGSKSIKIQKQANISDENIIQKLKLILFSLREQSQKVIDHYKKEIQIRDIQLSSFQKQLSQLKDEKDQIQKKLEQYLPSTYHSRDDGMSINIVKQKSQSTSKLNSFQQILQKINSINQCYQKVGNSNCKLSQLSSTRINQLQSDCCEGAASNAKFSNKTDSCHLPVKADINDLGLQSKNAFYQKSQFSSSTSSKQSDFISLKPKIESYLSDVKEIQQILQKRQKKHENNKNNNISSSNHKRATSQINECQKKLYYHLNPLPKSLIQRKVQIPKFYERAFYPRKSYKPEEVEIIVSSEQRKAFTELERQNV